MNWRPIQKMKRKSGGQNRELCGPSIQTNRKRAQFHLGDLNGQGIVVMIIIAQIGVIASNPLGSEGVIHHLREGLKEPKTSASTVERLDTGKKDCVTF